MNGEQIRAAREARGWTQTRLARELKVGVGTISNWERGETLPRSRTGMISKLLGIVDEPQQDGGLASLSDVELLHELTRRALAREQS